MMTMQKFSSVHAAFHNHFNQDRHLISRETFKARRSAALAEWETLAGKALRPLPHLRSVETSCRWTDSTATGPAPDIRTPPFRARRDGAAA